MAPGGPGYFQKLRAESAASPSSRELPSIGQGFFCCWAASFKTSDLELPGHGGAATTASTLKRAIPLGGGHEQGSSEEAV